MVHQFKNNGYDIVLDVNSGAIHVVDDVTYDVIAMYEEHTKEEILAALSDKYSKTERRTVHGGCIRESYYRFQEASDGSQGALPAYCT